MFSVLRPSDQTIAERFSIRRTSELTYPGIGGTRHDQAPAGYKVNQASALIGHGEMGFQKAVQAIRDLRMLRLGWIEPVGPREQLSENSLIATLARQFGVYSLNVARVVYLEDSEPHRFGFGYGTTADYPLAGEERFSVIIDRATQAVRFEIYSFSRPASLLMKLGAPVIRRMQRRFCREAVAAMTVACQS
jgi:uncharacterized protein (UPF0548 family)